MTARCSMTRFSNYGVLCLLILGGACNPDKTEHKQRILLLHLSTFNDLCGSAAPSFEKYQVDSVPQVYPDIATLLRILSGTQPEYEVEVQPSTTKIITDYVLRTKSGQEFLVCADSTQRIIAAFNVSMDSSSPEMVVYRLASVSAQTLCEHTRDPAFALNAINRVVIPHE